MTIEAILFMAGAAALVIYGIYLVGQGVRAGLQIRHLNQRGILADGQVRKTWRKTIPIVKNQVIYADYEFLPEGENEPITYTQQIGRPVEHKLIRQRKIRVLYLPDKPSVSMLAGQHRDLSRRDNALINGGLLIGIGGWGLLLATDAVLAFMVFLGFFGLFFALMALLLIGIAPIYWWRSRRVEREGIITSGRVLEIKRTGSRRRPTFAVYYEYIVKMPDGTSQFFWSNQQTYTPQHFPPGKPLEVKYLPDNPSLSMIIGQHRESPLISVALMLFVALITLPLGLWMLKTAISVMDNP